MLRLEASAAYGINPSVFFKGGVNYATFISSNVDEYDGGFGLQAGVGVLLTKNVGLDLNLTSMNFKASTNDGEVDGDAKLELSGFEIGLTATF